MVSFIAVSAAFLQFVSGIFIFKKPEIINPSATWISGLTALLAECLILWSIPLYPKKLRRLIPVGSCLFDYLASTFLIEYYMANFWFPLEDIVMSLPEFTSQNIEISLVGYSSYFEYVSVFLRQESLGTVFDHLLSFSTLILAMHATRMIDLSLFTRGPIPFLSDIKDNIQRFWKYTLCPIIPSIPLPQRLKHGLKGKRRDEDEYLGEDEEDEECDREERNSIELNEDYSREDGSLNLHEQFEEEEEELPPQEFYIFRRR